jgi:putative glutamine amidotransferase
MSPGATDLTPMRAKPLILISPGLKLVTEELCLLVSQAYAQAIIDAGGIPWILPCTTSPEMMAACVERCDGVMLTGGDDVQPDLYREKLPTRLKKTVQAAEPARDVSELLLIREVFLQQKPLLAICRGMQLLHVAFGGKLVVDISSQNKAALNHSRFDRRWDLVHQITLSPDSLLARIFKKEKIGVNSSHHQAVADLAKPFRAAALSPDGIVEALELAERGLLPYLLAVQFHPERLIGAHPEFLELFRSFTKACLPGVKR